MKRINFTKPWLMVACLALVLSACATTQDEILVDDPALDEPIPLEESTTTDDGGDAGADTSGLDGVDDGSTTAIVEMEPLTVLEMIEKTDGELANRTVYFEFDSAKLTSESIAMLEIHGDFVAGNGEVSVRLEGHADERGSREYNIALGDRRAQSVRRVLLFQGVSNDQVDTVSYGEENPAVAGHNEAAWAKNRRVELIYKVN